MIPFMETRVEIRSKSARNQNISLSQELKNHPAYRNFLLSIKAQATRESYEFYFSKFLYYNPIYTRIGFDKLLKIEIKELETTIIETMMKMREADSSYSAINALLSSLTHFFSINDVSLNWIKISKFKGENQDKFEYKSYTREEIARLLSILDERGKTAVLLMASTGMRVGGLAELRLKHIQKRFINNSKDTFVHKIIVYGSSSKHRYTTFCTPEAAKALDEYLNMRKRYGENLCQDQEKGIWTPGDTPVIIRQFNKDKLNHNALPLKPMTINIKIVSAKLSQLGIRNNKDLFKFTGNNKHPGTYKYELHPCHSLRIFAVTQMQRARIDKTIREMLIGHSVGLDSSYYKPEEDEILEEYLKAVDNLTINNEQRLEKELDHYKRNSQDIQEISRQLNMNYESKIESMRTELENKFKELLERVNVSELSD